MVRGRRLRRQATAVAEEVKVEPLKLRTAWRVPTGIPKCSHAHLMTRFDLQDIIYPCFLMVLYIIRPWEGHVWLKAGFQDVQNSFKRRGVLPNGMRYVVLRHLVPKGRLEVK